MHVQMVFYRVHPQELFVNRPVKIDGRLKQNSKVILEEDFLKRHETAVVDDRGVRNEWVWAWLGCHDANEDSLQVSITDIRDMFFQAAFNFLQSYNSIT